MFNLFAGLPGSGKSTITRALAKELGVVYLRIDTIEQAIRCAENHDKETGPVGYFVAYELARDNLKLGLNVIADSVNPLLLTREAYREVALSTGSKFLDIEVICSDLNTHRTHVENRISDIEGLKLPDWNAVITREYEQWDQEHLIIDSSKLSVKQCVEAIINTL